MLNGVYIEKGLRPYLNKVADWKKPRFLGGVQSHFHT
jgi:hypothetical protein